ncbi:MAG TPA: VCBS repeat-containing protein [Kiritimatiellia bacterium]|nr:VCBS repeat-containing protein [Kiritimatiellia bacterium]
MKSNILKKALLVVFTSGAIVSAQTPQILQIGPEEIPPVGLGRLPGIAVDTLNQPHIIADGAPIIHFYDKIGTQWRHMSKNMQPITGSGQFFNTQVEIDSQNRAWYTGILFGGSFGIAMVVRDNMAVNPSDFSSFNRVRLAPVWDVGNASVDPARPNEVVVSSTDGKWRRYVFNPNVPSRASIVGEGQMYAGQGGEKNSFWISKAGPITHPNGSVQSVFHGATGGWGASPSAYQNSVRQMQGLGPVQWASYSRYPTQGDDGTYVRVVSDSKEPQVAYIIADFSTGGKYANTIGVAMNIWSGTGMRRPSGDLLVLDRNGNSGLRRFSPQTWPAKNGGVWVTWQRGGRVKLRYVPANANNINDCGPEIDIGTGTRPAVTVDSRGDVHLAYFIPGVGAGGLRYRKLTVSGGGAALTKTGDFNGNGFDDLATYNDETRRWHIRTADGSVLLTNELFGATNVLPVVGKFSSTNVSTIGYFNPATARWTIRNQFNNPSLLLNNETFGVANVKPIVGDFDGDGFDDLGTLNLVNFNWRARNVAGDILISGRQHGAAGMIPVPGDFDGDGQADLGVYNPANARWYIIRPNGSVITWGRQWGFAGGIPVVQDFNGNGKDDMGIYDPRTMRWYVVDAQNGALIMAGRKHGTGNSIPAPGKYMDLGNGPAANLATFNPANGRWSVLANEGDSLQPGLAPAVNGVPVPGDYFGNGLTKAIFEPNGGNWRIQNGANVITINWGGPGMIPVPGDYNGDGRTDLAVYANGLWYIRTVAGQVLAWGVQHGFPGAVPVAGNYDNDNRHDLAVYHEATGRWYIRRLSGQIIAWNIHHGFAGARSVAGDFNGDGQADLAVWNRNDGRWYIRSVGGTPIVWGAQHGVSGFTPVSGDLNGNGRSDLIVYNSNNYRWYAVDAFNPSAIVDGVFGTQWGQQDAVPVMFGNNLAVMQQDRTWYVRENVNDVIDIIANSGQTNAIPIGSPGL